MSEIRLTSEIAVEVVDKMGDDASLGHAAWVSPPHRSRRTAEAPLGLTPKDKPVTLELLRAGLLQTLIEKRHGTPFEHSCLTLYVHAPICVWREWHRHRIAWSYNEESGRYKDLEPVFYIPPRGRPAIRPEGFKSMRPSFDVPTDEEYEMILIHLKLGYEHAYMKYQQMLEMQVDRGLARDVLGVGIYSSCYCTCNPRSLMAMLELRTTEPTAKRPSAPLYEIEVAARKAEQFFKEYWPVTYELWNKHGRMAP